MILFRDVKFGNNFTEKTIEDITQFSIIGNIFAIFNKVNFSTFQRSFCEKRYYCFPKGFVICNVFYIQITVVQLFCSSQQFFTKFEVLLVSFSSVLQKLISL